MGGLKIFPVNFAVQIRSVLFRTAEGTTKSTSAVMTNEVLFEADAYDAAQGWSVIVRGRTRTLRFDDEIEEADALVWSVDRDDESSLRAHRADHLDHGPSFSVRPRAGSRQLVRSDDSPAPPGPRPHVPQVHLVAE